MTLRYSVSIALFLIGSALPLTAQSSSSNPPDDGLNLRFTNGIAAVVENKVITVDDVRREISPYIAQLQRESTSEAEFNRKLRHLQDTVIQQLIDRVLIINAFRKDKKRRIPPGYVDREIADIQTNQFDNDRSKFLAYLKSRGMTMLDYRKEVEDNIIYQYMRQQQRKSQSIVSPVRIEEFYKKNKQKFYQEDSVHLRLIQFHRAPGETDRQLLTKAREVINRFKNGVPFADLAREYSQDSRRAKGGDWGWQKRSQLKKEFSTPLFALKKGQVSQPIITPEGCFILYAQDRKYAGIQPLADVRDQIEQILVQKMSQASQEKWLERLRRNGYVKRF